MDWFTSRCHYRDFRELGKGGMGLAVLVRKDLKFDDNHSRVLKDGEAYVVWKVPLAEKLKDPKDGLGDIVREADAICGLNEPNIVCLEHVGVLPVDVAKALGASGKGIKVPFIEMEYLSGGDLHFFMQMHKSLGLAMPAEVIGYIMQNIARGCQQAYSARKIIHRDLCPRNVGFLSTGEVKIMDYGIAVAAATRAASFLDRFAGKLTYASPEQVAGPLELYEKPLSGEEFEQTRTNLLGQLSIRSDIYTIGLIGHELACFDNPLSRSRGGGNIFEILGNARDARLKFAEDYRFRPKMSEGDRVLNKIISRCVSYDASGRYPSPSALVSDLDTLVRGFQWEHFSNYFFGVSSEYSILSSEADRLIYNWAKRLNKNFELIPDRKKIPFLRKLARKHGVKEGDFVAPANFLDEQLRIGAYRFFAAVDAEDYGLWEKY